MEFLRLRMEASKLAQPPRQHDRGADRLFNLLDQHLGSRDGSLGTREKVF